MPPKALPIEPEFLRCRSQEMLIQIAVVTANGGLLPPRWMCLDLKDEALWIALAEQLQVSRQISHRHITTGIVVLGFVQVATVIPLAHQDGVAAEVQVLLLEAEYLRHSERAEETHGARYANVVWLGCQQLPGLFIGEFPLFPRRTFAADMHALDGVFVFPHAPLNCLGEDAGQSITDVRGR